MDKNVFSDLPVEIRDQIDALLEEGGKTIDGVKRERFAQAWKKKHDLFAGQISTCKKNARRISIRTLLFSFHDIKCQSV